MRKLMFCLLLTPCLQNAVASSSPETHQSMIAERQDNWLHYMQHPSSRGFLEIGKHQQSFMNWARGEVANKSDEDAMEFRSHLRTAARYARRHKAKDTKTEKRVADVGTVAGAGANMTQWGRWSPAMVATTALAGLGARYATKGMYWFVSEMFWGQSDVEKGYQAMIDICNEVGYAQAEKADKAAHRAKKGHHGKHHEHHGTHMGMGMGFSTSLFD